MWGFLLSEKKFVGTEYSQICMLISLQIVTLGFTANLDFPCSAYTRFYQERQFFDRFPLKINIPFRIFVKDLFNTLITYFNEIQAINCKMTKVNMLKSVKYLNISQAIY